MLTLDIDNTQNDHPMRTPPYYSHHHVSIYLAVATIVDKTKAALLHLSRQDLLNRVARRHKISKLIC